MPKSERKLKKANRKRAHTTESGVTIPAKIPHQESNNGPTLADLPFMVVVQIASELPLHDMYSFWQSCPIAYRAIAHYWYTRQTLSLTPATISHYFPQMTFEASTFDTLFNLKHLVSQLIGCVPHHRIKTLDFRGVRTLNWTTFTDIFDDTGVDLFNCLSCVETIYLDGCILSSDDLDGISAVTCGVRHISLSTNLTHIYTGDEIGPVLKANVRDEAHLVNSKMLTPRRRLIIDRLNSLFPALRSVTLN